MHCPGTRRAPCDPHQGRAHPEQPPRPGQERPGQPDPALAPALPPLPDPPLPSCFPQSSAVPAVPWHSRGLGAAHLRALGTASSGWDPWICQDSPGIPMAGSSGIQEEQGPSQSLSLDTCTLFQGIQEPLEPHPMPGLPARVVPALPAPRKLGSFRSPPALGSVWGTAPSSSSFQAQAQPQSGMSWKRKPSREAKMNGKSWKSGKRV